MRQAIITAPLLLAACGGGSDKAEVSADNAATAGSAQPQKLDNELVETANGAAVLRLEGNDSATFVDGNLVEVNRAE